MFKRFVFIVVFVLASSAAQAAPLPDLTIVEVKAGIPDKGEIWVRIKNIGQATSAPSAFHVVLHNFLGFPGKTVIFASPHPGLASGAEKWVLIKSNDSLAQVKYTIRVNGKAQINESNFSNNSKVGQFSEKP
jgi:hypothetical protein